MADAAAVGVAVLQPGAFQVAPLYPELRKLKTPRKAAVNCRMSLAWRLRKNVPRVAEAVEGAAEA